MNFFILMYIEKKYAIAFFHCKQISAQDIQTKLAEVYDSQAYQIGSVTYWIKQIILGCENLHNELKREKPIDESITFAKKNHSYLSTHKIHE